MSYDLYFTSPKIAREEFQSYFSKRSFYNLTRDQAWYENPDTGVYFSFDYNEGPPEDEEMDYSVGFNLNYYRPHYFALEAEPEITNFVERFSCSIFDPQNEGMADGPYSPDGFFKGWNTINEIAYHSILDQEKPAEPFAKPSNELEDIWRWNYKRLETQENFGQDIFVPVIRFLNFSNKLSSFVVWPDAIGELIPEVDALFIGRELLAPKKLFGKKKDHCIISMADALPVIRPYQTEAFPIKAYCLPDSDMPHDIIEFVKALKPTKEKIEVVSFDRVLNEELVEKYK